MDISNRFSLEDFLAYFFPGFAGTLGLYFLLLLTPLRTSLSVISADIITGILLLFLCYVIGVVLSGFSEPLINFYGMTFRQKRIKDALPLVGYEDEILSAFKHVFKISKGDKLEWSASCFYLCRSLVLDHMPNLGATIQRQSSLRQLRMNLLPAFFVWLLAGVFWGIRALNGNLVNWGIGLIVASVILFLLITGITLDRMYSNERREVREVLSAFIAGFRTGKLTHETNEKKTGVKSP